MTIRDFRSGSNVNSAHGRRALRAYTRWVAFTDLIIIGSCILTALLLRFGLHDPVRHHRPLPTPVHVAAGVLIIAWWLVLFFAGAYDRRFVGSGSREYSVVVKGTLGTFSALAIISYAFRLQIARSLVLFALPVGIILLVLGHWGWRQWLWRRRKGGDLISTVLAVGDARALSRLIATLDRSPEAGYRVIGACCSDPPEGAAVIAGSGHRRVPILAGELSAADLAEELSVDIVACAQSSVFGAEAVRQLSWRLEGSRTEIMVVPALTDVSGPRVATRPVNGLPLLLIEQPEFSGATLVLKTITDVVLSLFALVVLSPLLIGIALTIKVSDGGPALFRQRRVGRNGAEFTMLKFRSMRVGAERDHGRLMASIGAEDGVNRGPMFKARNDPRITPVGSFLRRTSLDELPQLINILRGDMSLVGPRPPLPGEVATYDHAAARRLLVRPGLTGLWQVSGRSNLSWEESLRLDLYYVENWSYMGDLVIMFRTLKAVLAREGAF